jgi:hypothetical protein
MHYQAATDDAVISRSEAAFGDLERRVHVSDCIGSNVSQVTGVMLGRAWRTMPGRLGVEMLSRAGGIVRRAVANCVYVHAVRTVGLKSG